MHETAIGLIAALITLAGVALMLCAFLSPLERRLVAAAYGCRADQLVRNTDGVLVVATATRKAIR